MGFEDEYTDKLLIMNGKRGNRETLKNDVIVDCLLILLNGKQEYKNSMTNFFNELKEIAKSYNISLSEFPSIPNKLRAKLDRVQSNLKEEYGITYSVHNIGRYREIRIIQNMETDSIENS